MPLRIWDCEARGSDVQKTFKLHVLSDQRHHSPRSLIRTALNTFTHPEEPGTVQTHSAPRVPETVHGVAGPWSPLWCYRQRQSLSKS